MGTLEKERCMIRLQKVIAARDAAEKVAEGLSMGRGDRGMLTHQGGGGEGASKWCMHETNVAELGWVSFTITFRIVYRKMLCMMQGGPVGCTGGSLEFRPLCWSCRCDDQEMTNT